MKRFKYFICERDLIEIAHGNMDKVHYYVRKPKQCIDAYCDFNSFLEVTIEIDNPNKDATKSNMDKKRAIRSRLPKGNR